MRPRSWLPRSGATSRVVPRPEFVRSFANPGWADPGNRRALSGASPSTRAADLRRRRAESRPKRSPILYSDPQPSPSTTGRRGVLLRWSGVLSAFLATYALAQGMSLFAGLLLV